MQFQEITVTPEMAAKYLDKNEGNRKLREHRAAYLAQAITEGKWQLTHQPIAIGKSGRLLDGQHRLRAILLANKPASLVIATGVPDKVFSVLDAGLPRKMHERLRSDARHTAIMTQLFKFMVRHSPSAHEYEAQTMLEIFEPALLKLDQVKKPARSKIERAPHQAAIVLRAQMHLNQKEPDGVSRIQWLLEKVRRGDLVGAPPIIHAFYRQLIDGVKNQDLGVAPATDDFCRAWIAFNPENEAVKNLIVNDHGAELREARTEFKFITQGVFE